LVKSDEGFWILDFADARTVRVPRQFSGVFILGFPQNKKTTRQRTKQDFGLEKHALRGFY
jgi:hypothetical protein